MADKPNIGVPNIFPALRYENAPAAIEWLGKAFGFDKKFVVPGDNNSVMHAELRLGSGMIMMGSAGKPDPKNPWSTAPFGIYVMVKEIDAHYARPRQPGPRSCARSPTPITARASTRCATATGICGASAPTTLMRSPEP